MKYFLHDTSASDDEKITELFIEHGYEGLGLFYCILEKIAKQEKPIKTAVLKAQLKVGKKLEKCWSFMESLELISSNNGETFNERILSYSETYQVKKEKNRKRISDWRDNKEVEKNVTSYKNVRNDSKVKESKVKESKGNNTTQQAADFDNKVLILPWNSKKFLENWDRWKDYKKKQHRFTYKSLDSEQATLFDLAKISSGLENDAIEIINQSIAKGWAGLFELKIKQNGKSTIEDQRSAVQAEFDKRFGNG